jgi:ParB family chromosome partitioning protein
MGSDAKKAYNADGRDELLWWYPEKLTIVTNPESPLADPDRLAKPVAEWLVQSIMAKGVKVPIIVRTNGKDEDGVPIVEVVDGRQRVRAAVVANERLAAEGRQLVKVQGIRTRGTDADMLAVMIMTNELRAADTPLAKARKAQRCIDGGFSPSETAALFGVIVPTIKQWQALLDCAAPVQKAVEAGELPPTTAASFLSKLPREEQGPALEKMRAEGSLRGQAGVAAAERAIGKDRGQKEPDPDAVPLPSRVWLKRLLGELEAVLADSEHPHYGTDEGKVAVAVLKLVLEGKKPRGNVVAAAWREVQKRFNRSNGATEAHPS